MVSREEYKKFVGELVEKDKNNKNIKCLKKGYAVWAVFLLVICPIMFCGSFPVLFLVNGFLGCLLGCVSVSGIVFSIVRVVKRSKAVTYYSRNYSSQIIDYLFSGSKYFYNADGYINEKIFQESQFGGYYERYGGEDLLIVNIPNDDGSESNVNLNLCDLYVTKTEEDDDGNKSTVTVYAGVFGYVEFPFNFKCILGVNATYHTKGVKLEKVKLEDMFNGGLEQALPELIEKSGIKLF